MPNLSIEEWAAIAEIIGGLAVLVSLIYVAYEVRQNTRQLELNLKAERLMAFERTAQISNDMRELLITNEEVATLFRRGVNSFDELRGLDRFRVNMLFRNLFSQFQSSHVRHITWGGEEAMLRGQEGFMDGLLSHPGIREWLAAEEMDWHPAFSTFVDERLAATAEAPVDRPRI